MVIILDKKLQKKIERDVRKVPFYWEYDEVLEIYLPEIVIQEAKK